MTIQRRALRFCHFSLGSITRPGSLGIISARYLSTPLRQDKDITLWFKVPS